MLELDKTHFDLVTNYELDCETPEQAGATKTKVGAVRACRCRRPWRGARRDLVRFVGHHW